jgi:transcription elongation factor Elf1
MNMKSAPEQDCPDCTHTKGRYMPNISIQTQVFYFHCDACGHNWAVKKAEIHEPETDHAGFSRVSTRPN